jgi:NAD(P)-dependent dehydrogenase (short-subunit alcohol dehydrogenase family)
MAAGQPSAAQRISLAGRVAIVTGGGRGLGREMALALAEAGASVTITGARAAGELDATLADLRAVPGAGGALAVRADVRDAADCARVVAETQDRFGRIDILVNNAGRGMRLVSETFTTRPVPFWEVPHQTWREIVDINLNGAFAMAQAVVPAMLARGHGRIVNISTSDVTMVRKGYAPYGPSKAALEAMSRCMAQDLAGSGVTVNVLLPGGASDTELLPGGPGRRGADGNLLSPALMRAPIVWLASDASAAANGQRFIARLWDGALAPDAAAQAARAAPQDKPAIM